LDHNTEDPTMRKDMMEKRLSKLELISSVIPIEEQITIEFESESDTGSDTLIVVLSWGSTKGAILDSLFSLAKETKQVQFLYIQIKLLNPFPGKALEKFLQDKIEGIKNNAETSSNLRVKTVIIEMNYMSQLDLLIKQNTNLKADCNILKYNGRPMSNTEIYDSLLNIIQNKSKQRVILTNGV